MASPRQRYQFAHQHSNSEFAGGKRTLEHVRTLALTPNPRNARTHSRSQIEQLVKSIRQFGFVSPIVTDAERRIVAGYGRWRAAKQLGLRTVPVIALKDLSPTELRA